MIEHLRQPSIILPHKIFPMIYAIAPAVQTSWLAGLLLGTMGGQINRNAKITLLGENGTRLAKISILQGGLYRAG